MFALKGSVAPLTHVALRPPTSRARTVRTFAVGKKELVERVTERAGSMSKADVETVVRAPLDYRHSRPVHSGQTHVRSVDHAALPFPTNARGAVAMR
jgi:hypothetical protein